jgi:error-prone DNA polymerase
VKGHQALANGVDGCLGPAVDLEFAKDDREVILEAIESLRPAFVQGAQARGIGADVAETIFDQIAGYAGYGFCKSHAASFALIAYATCWLKVYHPAAFYCALLNQQPMGFYPVKVVVNDARRHHVPILRPDIHRSRTVCTLEPTSDNSEIRNAVLSLSKDPKSEIRMGFRFVKGVGEAGGERIEAARRAGAFRDLHDFCRRTRLPRRAVERLILVGAMDDWGVPRRKLLWELGKTEIREEGLDLELPPDDIQLPALTREELVDLEYSYLGLNVGEHAMALYRDQLPIPLAGGQPPVPGGRGLAQGVLSSRELASVPDGTTVRVAGLQVIRQRPSTAKGMVFVSLEDEWGLMNVVVQPAIYERYRHVWHPEPVEGWRGCRLVVVTGVVERRQGIVNVIARHVTGLSPADSGGRISANNYSGSCAGGFL